MTRKKDDKKLFSSDDMSSVANDGIKLGAEQVKRLAVFVIEKELSKHQKKSNNRSVVSVLTRLRNKIAGLKVDLQEFKLISTSRAEVHEEAMQVAEKARDRVHMNQALRKPRKSEK